jgi:hypothetical protein
MISSAHCEAQSLCRRLPRAASNCHSPRRPVFDGAEAAVQTDTAWNKADKRYSVTCT